MVIPGSGCAMETATGATEAATDAIETGGGIPCAIV